MKTEAPAPAGATDRLGIGSQHSSPSVGDEVQLWDHPHVLVTTFGRTYRAKARGRVARVDISSELGYAAPTVSAALSTLRNEES